MDTQPLSTSSCPKCQSPLPPDAPQGLCPKCLFAAVATPTEAGQPAGHRATPPPLEEIAAAFPQLEILEFIGQGGMGFVFKARQPKLDRLVALKILPQSLAADPTFAERFNREAKLLARLSHPGIVTVHDFGVATTQTPDAKSQTQFYYLLMEFVDGVNLRQAMQAGRFTPEQALAIVPKICEALQFAHNEGILHRDIKPENILLDAKGRVKLADFGIAKLMERESAPRSTSDAPDASSFGVPPLGGPLPANPYRLKPELQTALTEAGKTLGTPNYMAPEQLARPQDVDHRADIYSLGVVFYEMLTGELPQGRFAPPSQKSTADPRVDEVVLRALEKEKTKRYASADEVRTRVETISTSRSEQSESKQEGNRTVFGTAGLPPTKWTAAIMRSSMVFFCIAVLLFVYKSNDGKVREYWDQIVTILLIAFLADTLLRIRRWKKSENAAPPHNSGGGSAPTEPSKSKIKHTSAAAVKITRPRALVVTASLFIFTGLLSVAAMLFRSDASNLSIFPSAFALPIGIGLLRRREGCRRLATWGLALSFIFTMCMCGWVVGKAFGQFPNLNLVAMFLGRSVDGGIGAIALFLLLLAQLIAYPWLYLTLIRTEVRDQFASPSRRLPEAEWGLTLVILLLMLTGVHVPVKHSWQTGIIFANPPPTTREASPSANASFGPVIERTLPLTELGYSCSLNLETDEMNLLPASLTMADWSSGITLPNGIIVIAPTTNRALMVAGTGTSVRPLLNSLESWERPQWSQLDLSVEPKPGQTESVSGERSSPPVTFAFITERGTPGLLQITGFTENPRGVKIRYKLAQVGSAPKVPLPTKVIVLTRTTNQLVGTTSDTRTVGVWSDANLQPDEQLSALVERPDGEVKAATSQLFTQWSQGKVSMSTSFSWFFKELDGFGAAEADAATTQIRERTIRPLVLKATVPLVIFQVTNRFGGVMTGKVEFRKQTAAVIAAGKKAEASIRLRPYVGLLTFYSATVPSGYRLQATDNSSETGGHGAHTAFNGWTDSSSSWSAPSSMAYEQQQEACAQMKRLAEQGPIQVVLGTPRQMFSITNKAGEIYKGFFELIGPSTMIGTP